MKTTKLNVCYCCIAVFITCLYLLLERRHSFFKSSVFDIIDNHYASKDTSRRQQSAKPMSSVTLPNIHLPVILGKDNQTSIHTSSKPTPHRQVSVTAETHRNGKNVSLDNSTLKQDNINCELRFSNKTFPIVALASPPGSGNTWVRHLLQQSTGIYTGSVFTDGKLYRAGFLGEFENAYCDKVIVTKIHGTLGKVNKFSSVILLLRNLRDACLAELNRHFTGNDHTGFAKKKIEDHDVKEVLDGVSNVAINWLKSYNGPMLVVHYEDLLKDTTGEVTRMLDFLNVTESDRRMECLKKNVEGSFHRNGNKSADHYKIFDNFHETINTKTQMISAMLMKRGFKPMGPIN
ncbi:sialate:O-sulfotransferase 1-like [Saccoglossus kowalevskii]